MIGFPGIIAHLRDGTDRSDLRLPVWDVGYVDITDLIDYMQSDNPENNNTVIVEMDFDGMTR